MSSKKRKEIVKGGWVIRNPKNGLFVSVGTEKTVSNRSGITLKVAKEVSNRRADALKRLVDR